MVTDSYHSSHLYSIRQDAQSHKTWYLLQVTFKLPVAYL